MDDGFPIARSKLHLFTEQNHLDRISSRSYLKILGLYKGKFRTEDPQILGAIVQSLFSRMTWFPGWMRPFVKIFDCIGTGYDCEVLRARRWTSGLISKFIFLMIYRHMTKKGMCSASYRSLWESDFRTNECKLKLSRVGILLSGFIDWHRYDTCYPNYVMWVSMEIGHVGKLSRGNRWREGGTYMASGIGCSSFWSLWQLRCAVGVE
jgi:hypothetical protein